MSRAQRWLLPALLIALVLAWGGAGEARAARHQLRWSVGEGVQGCPGEEELRRAVEARLGYDPFGAVEAAVVNAYVIRKGSRIVGRLELYDRGGALVGERELDARAGRCDTLVAAMALAVAIAIEARQAAGGPLPRRSEPEPASARAPRQAPAAFVPGPPAPEPPPPVEPVFGAAGVLSGALGLTPGVTAGLALGVALRWTWWELGLEVSATAPGSEALETGTLEVARVGGALFGCARPLAALSTCLRFDAGALIGTGRGLIDGSTEALPALGGGLRVDAGFDLGLGEGVRLIGRLDLFLAATTATFNVSGEPVWSTPRVGASVGVGIGGEFE